MFIKKFDLWKKVTSIPRFGRKPTAYVFKLITENKIVTATESYHSLPQQMYSKKMTSISPSFWVIHFHTGTMLHFNRHGPAVTFVNKI